MTEQQPNPPTEAEIAAGKLYIEICSSLSFEKAIAKIINHNAPLHAKIEKQAKEIERLDKSLGETVDDRDKFEDQVQEIHLALGGDGEFSNNHDLGVESKEMIEALKSKLEKQKAALELAQKAIEAIAEFPMPNHNDTDYNCVVCGASSKEGHSTDCKYVLALAKIKEALD